MQVNVFCVGIYTYDFFSLKAEVANNNLINILTPVELR